VGRTLYASRYVLDRWKTPADMGLMRDWREPLLLRTGFVGCHRDGVCVKSSLGFDADFGPI